MQPIFPCPMPDARPAGRSLAARGITLMEVLISMGVLAVGLLGVAALIPAGRYQVAQGSRLEYASMVGRSALREIEVRGLLNPGGADGSTSTLNWVDGYTTGAEPLGHWSQWSQRVQRDRLCGVERNGGNHAVQLSIQQLADNDDEPVRRGDRSAGHHGTRGQLQESVSLQRPHTLGRRGRAAAADSDRAVPPIVVPGANVRRDFSQLG